MPAKLSFSENSIKIKSSGLFEKIIVTTGLLLIGLSAYLILFREMPLLFIFSAGLILTSIGALMMINSKYYKILINEEPGFIYIIETTFKKGITTLKIPVNYYTAVFIQKSMSGGGDSRSVSHEIHLLSSAGSSLFLASYSDSRQAGDAARELQSRLKIDLITESSLIGGMKNSQLNFHVENPEQSAIKKVNINNETRLSWKSGYGFPDLTAISLLLYGIFHLYRYTISGLITDNFIHTGLMILFIIICVFTLLFFSAGILGTNNLVLSHNEIRFYTSYFNKNVMPKKISRDNIGLIKNSINSGENAIAVFTKTGLDIVKKITDKIGNKGMTLDMAGSIFSLKDEVVMINTSSLTVKEKFYLETAIYYGL